MKVFVVAAGVCFFCKFAATHFLSDMVEHQFPWGHQGRYNNFSLQLRKTFPGKVQKISIDGGFTCPNRDGALAYEGCSYCNNSAFSPDYCRGIGSIGGQIQAGIDFFSRKYPSMQFLAYFQSYSNTYAELSLLKSRYEEALSVPGVVGLVIGTRPDCVDEAAWDYLARLSESCYVMVELGVESVRDDTLRRINRGHLFADAVRAIEQSAARNINNCAHLILGLPGESYTDFMEQARVISGLPIRNLKLHQLQIHKGARMAADYADNPTEFRLFSADEYASLLVDYLELLNPQVTVERFVSQAPPEMVIAPSWGMKNFEFTAKLEKLLVSRNSWQGKRYGKE